MIWEEEEDEEDGEDEEDEEEEEGNYCWPLMSICICVEHCSACNLSLTTNLSVKYYHHPCFIREVEAKKN